MAKAIHMMVRVLEEARSVDFYGKAFGLAVADRFEHADDVAGVSADARIDPQHRRSPCHRVAPPYSDPSSSRSA